MQNKRAFSSVMQDINSLYLPSVTCDEQRLNVAFILLEHFSMTSFTVAVDVLITANLIRDKSVFEVNSYALKEGNVTSDLGIDIATAGSISTLDAKKLAELDILIICGGLRTSLTANAALTKIIKQAQSQRIMLGSIWNGIIALAQANVITDQLCALHIDNHALLQEQYPSIDLSPNQYSLSETLISCSDAQGALGMMLKLLEIKHSPALSRAVQAILNASRSGPETTQNIMQYDESVPLPELLLGAIELMNANIEEPLPILEITKLLNSNRRQLERLFKQHLHTSPSRHYLEIRLTYARRLLLQTSASITNIAIASGFVSGNHFSYCFSQFFQVSPSRVRVTNTE
ncbi:MAG: helix-turn-helix domain-containing protein [Oceanospirillaceae bacterium]|nr:helix-turn-helix domain-containing protein [Oceanospirillaceae bacterium]